MNSISMVSKQLHKVKGKKRMGHDVCEGQFWRLFRRRGVEAETKGARWCYVSQSPSFFPFFSRPNYPLGIVIGERINSAMHTGK